MRTDFYAFLIDGYLIIASSTKDTNPKVLNVVFKLCKLIQKDLLGR